MTGKVYAQHLIIAVGVHILSWFFTVLMVTALAYGIAESGRPMTWFTNSWLLIFIYITPAVICLCGFHFAAARFVVKVFSVLVFRRTAVSGHISASRDPLVFNEVELNSKHNFIFVSTEGSECVGHRASVFRRSDAADDVATRSYDAQRHQLGRSLPPIRRGPTLPQRGTLQFAANFAPR